MEVCILSITALRDASHSSEVHDLPLLCARNTHFTIATIMADADEDVSHLATQEGAENDPTEETQDFRFLDKLMCAYTIILHSMRANNS